MRALAISAVALVLLGAGCAKKTDGNPYVNPANVRTPQAATPPTQAPVIPPQAKNVPLPVQQ